MPGNRCLASSATMRRRSPKSIGLGNNTSACAPPGYWGEGAVEIDGPLRSHKLKGHAESASRALCVLRHLLPRGFGIATGMPKCRHAGDPGKGLLEQREELRKVQTGYIGNTSNGEHG